MDLQSQVKVKKRRKKETNRLYIKQFWLIVKLIGLSPANTDYFVILNIILKQRFLSCNLYLFKNSENSFNFPFLKTTRTGKFKSF